MLISGKRYCSVCAENAKKRRHNKLRRGMCGAHGNIPVIPGKTFCYQCAENNRWNNINQNYGIDRDTYIQMYEAQNGCCAICGDTKSIPNTSIYGMSTAAQRRNILMVDHDHKSSRVRGLLCQLCNTALGGFKDNPEALDKAKEYLAKHAQND
jgi:hypothetical protein